MKEEKILGTLFQEIIDRTSQNDDLLWKYDNPKTKTKMESILPKMVHVLEIKNPVKIYGLRLLWKLSHRNVRITQTLLPK